jgi:hypothetical protein
MPEEFPVGRADQPLRAGVADGPAVVVLSTLPYATCRILDPSDPDHALDAYADGDGQVRIELHPQGMTRVVELVAECEGPDGQAERIDVRLEPASADTPLLPGLDEVRATVRPSAYRRAATEGIDVLALDADALAGLGLPSRPEPDATLRAVRLWERVVDQAFLPVRGHSIAVRTHVQPVEPAFAQAFGAKVQLANIWAGVAHTSAPGSYTQCDGFWRVPSIGSTSYPLASTAVWVGIGGNGTGSLIQCGTDSQALYHPLFGHLVVHYAWHEWWDGPSHRIPDVPVFSDDKVYARAGLDGGNAKYFVSNMEYGYTAWASDSAPAKPFSGRSAEWIVERPNLGGVLPLAPFQPVTISLGSAVANGRAWQPGDPAATEIIMVNPATGHMLAYPVRHGNDVEVDFFHSE